MGTVGVEVLKYASGRRWRKAFGGGSFGLTAGSVKGPRIKWRKAYGAVSRSRNCGPVACESAAKVDTKFVPKLSQKCSKKPTKMPPRDPPGALLGALGAP